ncbi:Structural maintenance of chromosomes protein 6 [Mycena sanguinolenta]|uniref:Structural maintenance of chromosomes protein 6 n=1 Tax=Mycena sanguinolenta TaxID=230812 RepID=A0A8H7CS96_9AGAR|nr:Structural maintenance of chromosomes protein 6 [Mycena sanguinolenta]
MNIQVDNPMNVLTQDAARQFLSASALQKSTSSFFAVLSFPNFPKILTQKKEAIPDLKAAYREANNRYAEASKAREQKKKKKKEMLAKVEEAAKQEKRLPKIEENIKKAEDKLAVSTMGSESWNGYIKHVVSQVKTVDSQIAQYKAAIAKENERLEKDTESKRQETQVVNWRA